MSWPQPTPAPPRSRRTLWIVLGSVAGVLVLCCVGALIIGAIVGPQPKTNVAGPAATSSTPIAAPSAPPTASPSTASKSSAPAAAQDPGREICSFTASGGTYYLSVVSETDHNMSACAGGTRYRGTLDDLFTVPGMDRRCILGPAGTAKYDALVGVYSTSRAADLREARAYCIANGGTDSG
jgi:hypothetical protein